MKRLLYFTLAFIGGVALTLEGAIGGALSQTIGELEASYYVFALIFLILTPFVLIFKRNNLKTIWQLPKWQWLGGFCGATFLVLLFFSVPKLGVGTTMTAVIIGQLFISIIIDHFGWLSAPKIIFNRSRFIAIILLMISLFLIL